MPAGAYVGLGCRARCSCSTPKHPVHCPHPQSGIRGHDSVEEYDPIERMRRMSGANTAVTSLEEELKELHAKHDIHHFDYKPVPRTDEDDEG